MDDKTAREVAAPALFILQVDRLGVNEETLKYFGMVISAAVDGDGSISAANKEASLSTGNAAVALLWATALAAYGIKPSVDRQGVRDFRVRTYRRRVGVDIRDIPRRRRKVLKPQGG
mgnify:CR=1 FL=1